VAAGKKAVGVDPGKPAYKVGYAQLKLDTSGHRLATTITPERERYAPGEEVVATVELRDAQGKPMSGEVTFMAVDEGVLSLTGYQTPDVLSQMYGERALAVMTREARRRLASRAELKRVAGDKGDEGGDGLAGMNYRAKFATTAAYMPLVHVDGSGRAQVRFVLPENLTTFRLMAVAVGDGHRFGGAESRIVVTKPLLVRPALPRFMATGDRLEVRAVVQATDGSSGPVEVEIAVSGALTLESGGKQTIELAAGEAREVSWPAVAGAPGEARVRFAVRGRGEGATDGVEVVVPVRYPAVEEQIVSSGQLTMQEPGLWRKLVLPQGITKQSGELEVELSSSAYGELLPGLSYLVDYPYGCVEQTTGRTLPMVLLEDTLKEWDTPGVKAGRLHAFAQSGVDRLISMQVSSGGLGYWPGADKAHPWGSVYGGLALVRAQQRGYAVPEPEQERLMEYLRQVMRAQVQTERWWTAETMATTSAFAAWVLAEAGKGEPSYHEHLYTTRWQLPPWSLGMLAMAIHKQRGGGALTDRSAEQVKVLVDEMLAGVVVDGGSASIGGAYDAERYWMTMDSSVRANAVALMTLLRVRASDPLVGQLARGLLEVRQGGRWISTQDNAFAVMALAEYLQTVEREAPEYDVVVGLGERVLATQTMRGRSTQIKRVRVPMAELAGAEGRLLTVTRQGKGGPLYYTLRLRHAAEAGSAAELHHGFSVKREYLHGEGELAGQPVERVKAGQLVSVRLTVVAPSARRYVVVEDPLPAGFEPISLSFATTGGAERRAVEGAQEPDWWWRPSFDHTEQRDDRVLLFADNMAAGIYVHQYLVRATTTGTFMAPGTRAAEMYHPEVFGAAPDRVVEVR
jgi:alpha-2-macroglobulin